MRAVLSVIHIVVSVMMIFAVLIQQRKQGGFSGVFGGGTQADSGQWQRFTNLTKLTIILAVIFMVTSFFIVFLN
ncbi:MAG: preprotein translocase subunit SecG [Synergistaceae bacterium]|nr:preprotein translocase subunit SecG [Synergistaceae bacterium]MBQ3347267.1 preprotein translocase subunit SecG [Synergistaceae bacterium]MBQ3397259.1 preprotein translocase subunit SecG [Synergistaceae bacterium]MBQ3760302.1 preprotein translocase subunit SecG [Synergistaceae bacterium]MBQ4401039.1 preprotein translocase subunit SecG [Synergistaceae bacterium]